MPHRTSISDLPLYAGRSLAFSFPSLGTEHAFLLSEFETPANPV